jgi:hypothetical protein
MVTQSFKTNAMETQQLTSTGVHRARFTIKWRSRKGFAAVILFLLISVVFEILLIFAFQAMGLVDTNAWTTILQIPGTDWSFTVSVSLIFHLLPLSVVVVLLASWTYLTKSGVFIPKPETIKRASPPPRRIKEKPWQKIPAIRQDREEWVQQNTRSLIRFETPVTCSSHS